MFIVIRKEEEEKMKQMTDRLKILEPLKQDLELLLLRLFERKSSNENCSSNNTTQVNGNDLTSSLNSFHTNPSLINANPNSTHGNKSTSRTYFDKRTIEFADVTSKGMFFIFDDYFKGFVEEITKYPQFEFCDQKMVHEIFKKLNNHARLFIRYLIKHTQVANPHIFILFWKNMILSVDYILSSLIFQSLDEQKHVKNDCERDLKDKDKLISQLKAQIQDLQQQNVQMTDTILKMKLDFAKERV
jgi:hypothetical protein